MITRANTIPSIGYSFLTIDERDNTFNPGAFIEKSQIEAQGMVAKTLPPKFIDKVGAPFPIQQYENTSSLTKEPKTIDVPAKSAETIAPATNKPGSILPDTTELKTDVLKLADTTPENLNDTITIRRKNLIWIFLLVILLLVILVKLFK